MAKTLRDIQGVKNIDMVIEVVDARSINSSSNPELTAGFSKPKLTIALKSDLADTRGVVLASNTIMGSIKDKRFKQKIIDAIYGLMNDKITRLKSKGLLIPQFYILVVGLPNIGKSSLINFLSPNSKLIVENRPGVTRTRQLVKINQNFFMYDTPGVLVKKIENIQDGFKLSLIGAIKKEILPLHEITE